MADQDDSRWYYEVDGLLHKIKTQMRGPDGYPYDKDALRQRLDCITRGDFAWPESIVLSNRIGMAPEEEFDIVVDDTIPLEELLETFSSYPRLDFLGRMESLRAPSVGQRNAVAKLFSLMPGEEMKQLERRLQSQSFRLSQFREFLGFVMQKRKACSGLRVFCGESIGKIQYSGAKYVMHSSLSGSHLIYYPFTQFRWDMRSTCLGIREEKAL